MAGSRTPAAAPAAARGGVGASVCVCAGGLCSGPVSMCARPCSLVAGAGGRFAGAVGRPAVEDPAGRGSRCLHPRGRRWSPGGHADALPGRATPFGHLAMGMTGRCGRRSGPRRGRPGRRPGGRRPDASGGAGVLRRAPRELTTATPVPSAPSGGTMAPDGAPGRWPRARPCAPAVGGPRAGPGRAQSGDRPARSDPVRSGGRPAMTGPRPVEARCGG